MAKNNFQKHQENANIIANYLQQHHIKYEQVKRKGHRTTFRTKFGDICPVSGIKAKRPELLKVYEKQSDSSVYDNIIYAGIIDGKIQGFVKGIDMYEACIQTYENRRKRTGKQPPTQWFWPDDSVWKQWKQIIKNNLGILNLYTPNSTSHHKFNTYSIKQTEKVINIYLEI